MYEPSVSGDALIRNRAVSGTNVQARSNPASLRGEEDRVRAVGDAQLAIEVVYVAANGALSDPEIRCDLLVALAVGKSAKGFLLHRGERRRTLRQARATRPLELVDDRVKCRFF